MPPAVCPLLLSPEPPLMSQKRRRLGGLQGGCVLLTGLEAGSTRPHRGGGASQGLLSSGTAHWPEQHSGPWWMVPAACLPTPSGWGDPGPAHDTPTASGMPVDAASCCPQVCLSVVVLCTTTRPPLTPSSWPRITATILSSLMGHAWPAAEAAFPRCRSRCGGGGGMSLPCGLKAGLVGILSAEALGMESHLWVSAGPRLQRLCW